MDPSSTLTINFSLRQNKAIERAIAFDVLSAARPAIGDDPVYVGLGSVWFQDFRLAHRVFQPSLMITIEGDDEIRKRVDFNLPYRSIEPHLGYTNVVIPELLEREDLTPKPWIVWLDYDRAINEARLDELEALVQSLADGSALLTTFNAKAGNYGESPEDRQESLYRLFGETIVGSVEEDDLLGEAFSWTLTRCVSDFLRSTAVQAGRSGPYIPALDLIYRDSTYMATVGGFLPAIELADFVEDLVSTPEWIGFEPKVISTQPLTRREIDALTTLLPRSGHISTQEVDDLGFSLPDAQVEFFTRHYLRYPTYAEIM